MKTLAIVSPCYNEESIIKDSARCLSSIISNLKRKKRISEDSFVLFVDDGSSDSTWPHIVDLSQEDSNIKAVRLQNNAGHQNAILAGLMIVKETVDAAITIDSDLQDDISSIEKMLDAYYEGAEIVYGVKKDRGNDPFFKRITAKGFYKLQKAFGAGFIENHADFRLMSQSVLIELARYGERNLYLRGILQNMGYKGAIVEEEISKRKDGDSKYTLKKMFQLASDGITSFSIKPINIVLVTGVILLTIAAIMAIYVFISVLSGHYTPGWASIMISIWFIGACVLISIGIVGIYVGKIYIEVKKRPLYTIKETIGL